LDDKLPYLITAWGATEFEIIVRNPVDRKSKPSCSERECYCVLDEKKLNSRDWEGKGQAHGEAEARKNVKTDSFLSEKEGGETELLGLAGVHQK